MAAFGLGGLNIDSVANGINEAAKHIASTWLDASKRLESEIPQITAQLFPYILKASISKGYTEAAARGELRFLVYLPSPPGPVGKFFIVSVAKKLAVAVSPGGGRLFGFGVATIKKREKIQQQFFRVDYFDTFKNPGGILRYHYHVQPSLENHHYF